MTSFASLVLAAASVAASSADELAAGGAVYRLDGRTGGVREVVRAADGATVVTRVVNDYLVKSADGDRRAREADDAVVRREGLSFVCTNAALPGLGIGKRYFPVNGGLGRELTFRNDGERMLFVLPYTSCGFAKDFWEEASYFGAGYVGPLLPVARVTRPTLEETFVQTSKGMALLNTVRPARGSFANLRVKVAGRAVLPWWQSTIGSYREGEDRLSYLPDGWRMCLGTLDAPPHGEIAYEDRLTFFAGGLFQLVDEVYGKDPAIAALYAGLGPSDPRLLDVLCTYSWGFEPFGKYLSEMTDGGALVNKTMISAGWADYRWENGFVGQAGGWVEGAEARDFVRGMQVPRDRMLAGTYGILIAADPRTKVFAEHPEWFRTLDRRGRPQSHFPGVVANYQSMVNRADCRAFLARTACDNAALTGADYVYTDEAQQENRINWQQQALVRDDHWIDLWADMRRRARAAGRFLFFNGSGNPFADLNYMECSPRQANPDNWREFAGVVLGIEMVSRLRPEGRIAVINYTRNFVNAISHCLAVGWIPTAHGTEGGRYLSHYRAVRETGKTLPVDARYAPDWKRDATTPFESYAVRRLGSRDVLVSFVNRAKRLADIPVELDLGSLGFSAHETVTVRAYRTWYPTAPAEAREVLSDRDLRAAYAETGADLDCVAEMSTVHCGAAKGTLRHLFDSVTTNGTVQLVVTPGVATVAAADGLPAHYLYTRRRGVEIRDGRVTAEVPCEIAFAAADGGMTRARMSPGTQTLEALRRTAAAFVPDRRRPGRAASVDFESLRYPKTPAFCKVDARTGRYVSSYRNLRNLQTNLAPATVEADADRRVLRAGTTRRNDTLDVNVYAGLRLKGAKTVRLELTNSFWNASSVFSEGSHSWGNGVPERDFAGLVVDYRAAGGTYVKRVDFSVGLGGSRLVNPLPPWGAGRRQDEHYSLGDLLSTPRTVFSLDLAKHAPTNWNGETFLSLGTTHVLANRRLELRVVSTDDRSAGDFLAERRIVSGTFAGQMPAPVALPRLKTAPSAGAEGFAGKGTWGTIAGLQPYGADDFSANSRAAVAYDGASLHFDLFADETEKKAPKADDDLPYKNDSFELYFRLPEGKYLQVVVDAAGRVRTFPDAAFPSEEIFAKAYARAGKGWGVCVSVPYRALAGFDGTLGSEIRFNLCRVRKIRRGERSVWAPVRPGHGAFRDFEKFGLLTVGRLAAGMGRWEEFQGE